MEIVIATNPLMRKQLGSLLNLSDITYPLIIIQGMYVGGSDNLLKLTRNGMFSMCLDASTHAAVDVGTDEVTRIPWYAPLELEANTPDLFRMPSTQTTKINLPWYYFQPYMYSNLVRYISLFQIVWMGLCVCLLAAPKNTLAQYVGFVFTYLFIFDLLLLVVHGPAPFSISGSLCTYFAWRYRGNITSSIPYKVVFGVYMVVLIPLVTAKSRIGLLSAYTGLLFNSSLLAVFRF